MVENTLYWCVAFFVLFATTYIFWWMLRSLIFVHRNNGGFLDWAIVFTYGFGGLLNASFVALGTLNKLSGIAPMVCTVLLCILLLLMSAWDKRMKETEILRAMKEGRVSFESIEPPFGTLKLVGTEKENR